MIGHRVRAGHRRESGVMVTFWKSCISLPIIALALALLACGAGATPADSPAAGAPLLPLETQVPLETQANPEANPEATPLPQDLSAETQPLPQNQPENQPAEPPARKGPPGEAASSLTGPDAPSLDQPGQPPDGSDDAGPVQEYRSTRIPPARAKRPGRPGRSSPRRSFLCRKNQPPCPRIRPASSSSDTTTPGVSRCMSIPLPRAQANWRRWRPGDWR